LSTSRLGQNFEHLGLSTGLVHIPV